MNASFAVWTAASISSTVAKSTAPVCSPVAGFQTGPLRPDVPGNALASDPVVNRLRRGGAIVSVILLSSSSNLSTVASVARRIRADGRHGVQTRPRATQVVADDRAHLIHSWSVQSALNPIPVAGAEGRYFWDYNGKRYLDFAAQLVNLALGHQHPKLVAAIKEQADRALHDRAEPRERQALRARAASSPR